VGKTAGKTARELLTDMDAAKINSTQHCLVIALISSFDHA
jgi:hypothetical protein